MAVILEASRYYTYTYREDEGSGGEQVKSRNFTSQPSDPACHTTMVEAVVIMVISPTKKWFQIILTAPSK